MSYLYGKYMNKQKVYLDYAATTPLDQEVFAKMRPYFTQKFGNVMSIHSFGQEALKAVDTARRQAADFFNCTPSEIVFTSGATESNNLVVKGSLRSFYSIKREKSEKPHIITAAFEHHCVLDACKFSEREGLVDVTYISPRKDGLMRVTDIQKAIRPNTILVSVMYVNNEIGTVQPIAQIGKLLKKENAKRTSEGLWPIAFHTDATQAVNYFDCNVENLGTDLLSISAHKIYGPKGVGLLYVRKNTYLKRIQDGGDQEYKLRSGTHNVPGIVGLGAALEKISDKKQETRNKEIQKLRDYLIKKVLKEIPKSYLNGDAIKRSPNNANFRFDNVEGEGLVLALDLEGISASTGSACSSGALEPSHVLLSLGLKHEQAHGSLRLTIGKHTTKQEIDRTVTVLKKVIIRLRKISGNVLEDFK